jgi:thiol:disulfide interchange protein
MAEMNTIKQIFGLPFLAIAWLFGHLVKILIKLSGKGGL